MSMLSQFTGGQRRVAAIVNRFSTNGCDACPLATGNPYATKELITGAISAGVLTTALSIVGRGCINYCGVKSGDTTSRTLRLKVTIDGAVVFDSTSAAIVTNGAGIVAVGAPAGAFLSTLQQIYFSSSLLVEVASSRSETALISALVNYEVHQ